MTRWHLILAGSLILGAFAAPAAIDKAKIETLPDNQKLKADTVVSYSVEGEDVRYLYPEKEIIAEPDEIVERRTSNARTYSRNGRTEIYFDAVTPYYKDEGGKWWHTKEATTTKDAFDLQTKTSFLFKSAYAAGDTLTANPGSGNQTWSVPSDWNSSNNQVACIGSGGQGGHPGGTNGGGGGGAGAYASTTNITLTPGGTATYSIGASATTTTATPAVTPARETFFNSTASSTASLFCDWGRFANGTAAGAAGTDTLSIGTTKYSGGAGGAGGSQRTGGGGGSGGMYGAGKTGSACSFNARGGGGGGSNGGSSSNGGTCDISGGGAGGNGTDGTGGGVAPGGDATAGKGAGGAGGASSGGGNGSVDTTFDATHGGSGGGGGAAGSSFSPGNGGTYGGGAGGDYTSGGSATGGQGLIVIIYTPAAGATTYEANDWWSVFE